MKPSLAVINNNLYLSKELGEKIIAEVTTAFSCGATKENFREGDFAYFGESVYRKLGCNIDYLCKLAIRRSNRAPGYAFVLAGVSGDYGFNFGWMLQRHLFSNRVKNQIFPQAEKILAQRGLV